MQHFVQMARGIGVEGHTEVRIAGLAQKMTVALLEHVPGAEEVESLVHVGQGEGMRMRPGTWGHKALVLVRVLPES